MDVQTRVLEAKQKFDELDSKRKAALDTAQECLTEMTRLQGEYRVLTEMAEQQQAEEGQAQDALTIDATPEPQQDSEEATE